ncbi:hypothetical protein A4G99_00800 [Haladaptatus sp. R4]|uniref:hypothetical protein n=1 Tax=Haladaptatus sp. R4 TaxID=1679489 RepID=UPI0007B4EE35|nr:hypothetical protein [Haladaptatus sp. R4]KZN25106.1 hypothetical protein A4G99_00800 [Haladaptatus sp. R4]
MLNETIDTNHGTVTTNHDAIMQWVEKHDGHPATDEMTPHSIEYLRIEFPNMDDTDALATVGWREWFEEFEAQELAFVYPDQDEYDDPSQAYKLVDRTTAAEHT